MSEPPANGAIDPKDVSSRADTNTAADLAGQFVADGCLHGCIGGCGCMVFIVLGLVLLTGPAVAAWAIR